MDEQTLPNLKNSRELVAKELVNVSWAPIGNKKRKMFLFNNTLVFAKELVGRYRLSAQIFNFNLMLSDENLSLFL